MGDFLKWVIAGLIGGAIGAAIWAGITYGTGYEVGWIAWGIGILVGFAVRVAAGNVEGAGPGAVAAVIAILSICAGKYAATSLLVNDVLGNLANLSVSEDAMIENHASRIAEEWNTAGKKMTWPDGMSLESASELAEFPPEVVAEAKKHWSELPADERQKQLAAPKEAFEQATSEIRFEAFKASFGPIDILFFFLAVASAFRLGAGSTND